MENHPKPQTSSQGRQVVRRDVLTGLPLAGTVVAIPALAHAGATETPVLQVYRQWQARFTRLSAEAEYLTDDEFDRGLAEVTVIERRLFALKAQTETDVLAQLVAVTWGGDAVALDGEPRAASIIADAVQFANAALR